ncbi:hypothetical protein E1301_Tti003372 [Triplophysa tibetana]|uniref:Uncharacterized protein n=1 Tax=Triplophysa tibetana TaxID=1572043 RepID=A0A5A9PNU2_9TELE|nr:hypothetical protein E1301_Tti003372 [Triplophysa tibetana]
MATDLGMTKNQEISTAEAGTTGDKLGRWFAAGQRANQSGQAQCRDKHHSPQGIRTPNQDLLQQRSFKVRQFRKEKTGKLKQPTTDLEDRLRKLYSNNHRQEPISISEDMPPIQLPEHHIDIRPPKWSDVESAITRPPSLFLLHLVCLRCLCFLSAPLLALRAPWVLLTSHGAACHQCHRAWKGPLCRLLPLSPQTPPRPSTPWHPLSHLLPRLHRRPVLGWLNRAPSSLQIRLVRSASLLRLWTLLLLLHFFLLRWPLPYLRPLLGHPSLRPLHGIPGLCLGHVVFGYAWARWILGVTLVLRLSTSSTAPCASATWTASPRGLSLVHSSLAS